MTDPDDLHAALTALQAAANASHDAEAAAAQQGVVNAQSAVTDRLNALSVLLSKQYGPAADPTIKAMRAYYADVALKVRAGTGEPDWMRLFRELTNEPKP